MMVSCDRFYLCSPVAAAERIERFHNGTETEASKEELRQAALFSKSIEAKLESALQATEDLRNALRGEAGHAVRQKGAEGCRGGTRGV